MWQSRSSCASIAEGQWEDECQDKKDGILGMKKVGFRLTVHIQFWVGFRVKLRVRLMFRIRISVGFRVKINVRIMSVSGWAWRYESQGQLSQGGVPFLLLLAGIKFSSNSPSSCFIYPGTENSINSESILLKYLNSVCRLIDLTLSTGQSSISPWCMCLAMWSNPWVPYQYWGDKCYTRE